MGTNYYLHMNPCQTCGRTDERLHIGKSSWGWCFGLHVTDEIPSLEAWTKKFSDGVIKDEYGDAVTVEGMLDRICNRRGSPRMEKHWPMMGYASEADFHAKNHSERGPNDLLRRQIDGRHCVGHGDGTWDYIQGDFS